jgi:Protein of unknown function (DUF1326)
MKELVMTRTIVTLLSVLAATPAFAAAPVIGEYVEARTAEVFAGGCVMSSQAETMGREAVLAWHIDRGAFDGQRLDGLSVVAAVAGDRNLGIREIGGESPSSIRSDVFVDARATAEQRRALVRLAQALSRGLVTDVVDVTPVAVRFDSSPTSVSVNAGAASLVVQKHAHHTPGCGAMTWFKPFSVVDGAMVGVADAHTYSGKALGITWSDPHKKSAFSGSFSWMPPADTSN